MATPEPLGLWALPSLWIIRKQSDRTRAGSRFLVLIFRRERGVAVRFGRLSDGWAMFLSFSMYRRVTSWEVGDAPSYRRVEN